MKTSVKFNNHFNQTLSGVLHTPDDQKVVAYALFAHCFTCTKDINAAANIANTLAIKGIATLRFDFTGLGASSGEFSNANFTTNIDDLVSAADFLGEEYAAPQILIGHSLGGTAVLEAAAKIPSAKAVATIGSPASPDHILHLLKSCMAHIKEQGEAEVTLSGRPFTFKQEFVDDVQHYNPDYSKLRKALMVMHAPMDSMVSIDEAEKIYIQAKHSKSFVSLDSADHLLSKNKDSGYAADMLSSWAARYITEPE